MEEKKKYGYVGNIIYGLKTLCIGLKVTFVEFFTKKVTDEYPDNRDTLVLPERFRGTLEMPHDQDGNNLCIACGLCESHCPNGTIQMETEMVTDPESGKRKKQLVTYRFDLGSCIFCQLCVNVCPTKAIRFTTEYEHAVFDRSRLVKTLNKVKEGNSLDRQIKLQA